LFDHKELLGELLAVFGGWENALPPEQLEVARRFRT
jgi:hypothetical protein